MRSIFRLIFFNNETNTYSNIIIFLILETKKEFLTKNDARQHIEMIAIAILPTTIFLSFSSIVSNRPFFFRISLHVSEIVEPLAISIELPYFLTNLTFEINPCLICY